MSFLQSFRNLHKKIATFLFIFFFIVSVTATLLAFKSSFSSVIYEDKKEIAEVPYNKFLQLDSLEYLATSQINKLAKTKFKQSERVDVKLSKGTVVFYYKDALSIQVNPINGKAIFIEKKYGGIIQDIHDGAILDGVIKNKNSLFKKGYTIILGLSLLLLTLTGTYLWCKPILIKKSKK